eukprot:TRINITY_DN5092_c0_g1_i1.p1 TRINITY_DN5092_c0_g1~~TRINITY_DN5092_c0_g1_i1.p1  ORF type:complete len:867 (-),score=116.54 TRINITY_DN5092_c0_g1_i1:250-2850(-)
MGGSNVVILCWLGLLTVAATVVSESQRQSQCLYAGTSSTTLYVIGLDDGHLIAQPDLASSGAVLSDIEGLEIVGDVLYASSGGSSVINMYNISDNVRFIGTYYEFQELFFLEGLAYSQADGRVFVASNDYPHILQFETNSSAPATAAINASSFLTAQEDVSSAVWYIRAATHPDGYPVLIMPTQDNVLNIKGLNASSSLVSIYNRKDHFGPLRWTGIWKPDANVSLSKTNDEFWRCQGLYTGTDEDGVFALSFNGTRLGQVLPPASHGDGYWDVAQDQQGNIYASTFMSSEIVKAPPPVAGLPSIPEVFVPFSGLTPYYLRIAKCPVIDPPEVVPKGDGDGKSDHTLLATILVPILVAACCCCVIALILAAGVLIQRQRYAIVEELKMADYYIDFGDNAELDMKDASLAFDKEMSYREREKGKERIPLVSMVVSEVAKRFQDLEDDVGIVAEPSSLIFSQIADQSLFPVNCEAGTSFKLYNRNNRSVAFKFYLPKDQSRFVARLWPGEGVIRSYETVDIFVAIELHMTTTIFDRFIRLDINSESYYMEISLVGEPSTYLDPDEIEMNLPPIGHGGFSTVYSGSYRGARVAVKVINGQLSPDSLQEFDKEVKMMTKLRSPYVINFVGASHVPNKLCLVTELCSLGSLNNLVFSDEGIKYGIILRMALHMALGVELLHKNGVIHRDLKIDNFMLISKSGKAPVMVKIADFGTSKIVQRPWELFRHTPGVGTPIYMAPELLAVYPKRPYNAKVDVYSFGLILWSIYVREEPYRQLPCIWDIPQTVLGGGRPKISKKSTMPDGYRRLMEHCWHQDQSQRPEMGEVVQTLNQLIEEATMDNTMADVVRPASVEKRGQMSGASTEEDKVHQP